MNSLEEMRKFEIYAEQSILDNCYFVIRSDGRHFSTEVENMNLDRPFDKKLRESMIEAIKVVMEDFNPLFAYTESDEVSFLFNRDMIDFNRRVEKITTLISAKMSAAFLKTEAGKSSTGLPTFDARTIVLPTEEDVINYFQWRQMDSHRNCISTYTFWKLVQDGVSKSKVQKMMDGKDDSWKNDLLFERFGINYNNVSDWEKKGNMIYWDTYEKEGYNPIEDEKVIVERRKLVDEEVNVHFRDDNLDKWINKGIKVFED